MESEVRKPALGAPRNAQTPGRMDAMKKILTVQMHGERNGNCYLQPGCICGPSNLGAGRAFSHFYYKLDSV